LRLEISAAERRWDVAGRWRKSLFGWQLQRLILRHAVFHRSVAEQRRARQSGETDAADNQRYRSSSSASVSAAGAALSAAARWPLNVNLRRTQPAAADADHRMNAFSVLESGFIRVLRGGGGVCHGLSLA